TGGYRHVCMHVDQPGLGYGSGCPSAELLSGQPAINPVHAVPGVSGERRPALRKQRAQECVLGGAGTTPRGEDVCPGPARAASVRYGGDSVDNVDPGAVVVQACPGSKRWQQPLLIHELVREQSLDLPDQDELTLLIEDFAADEGLPAAPAPAQIINAHLRAYALAREDR